MSIPDGLSPEQPQAAVRKSLFVLPEYDDAFVRFTDGAVHALANARDEVLAQMPRVRQRRTYRPRNSIAESTVHESPTMPASMLFELSLEAIRQCDADAVAEALSSVADQYLAAVMPQIFATLGSLTSATGNTLDTGGQGLTAEHILQMCEQVAIVFDDDGTPHLPALVMHPDDQRPDWTEEHAKRLREIIERKWQQFLAERRSRQLPRNPLGN
jgi:hypothetical protein